MKTAARAAIAAASMLVSAPRVFSQDNEPKSAADATRFPAATPEERADRYLKWCLAPRIADVSENLSEKERADLAEKSKVWSEQLRNAIIDFERVEVTPEGVVEEIKTGANSDQFSDQLVEYFRERLSFYGYKNDVFDGEKLAEADLDTANLHDTLRNGGVSRRTFGPDRSEKYLFEVIQSLQIRIYSKLPSGKLNDDELKQMKKRPYDIPSRLTYLFGPGKPPSGFSYLDYLQVRPEIVNGNSHLTEHCT
jgi:hypothetical protein